MRLQRLITLLIAVGLLIVVHRLMLGGRWGTLKGHVFGGESDAPPLCSPGSALVSDPMGKAELLTCHPRPAFCG